MKTKRIAITSMMSIMALMTIACGLREAPDAAGALVKSAVKRAGKADHTQLWEIMPGRNVYLEVRDRHYLKPFERPHAAAPGELGRSRLALEIRYELEGQSTFLREQLRYSEERGVPTPQFIFAPNLEQLVVINDNAAPALGEWEGYRAGFAIWNNSADHDLLITALQYVSALSLSAGSSEGPRRLDPGFSPRVVDFIPAADAGGAYSYAENLTVTRSGSQVRRRAYRFEFVPKGQGADRHLASLRSYVEELGASR